MENGDNMSQGMAPSQAMVNTSAVPEPEPVQEKRRVNVPAILFGITTLIFAGLAVYFGMEYFKPKGGQSGDAGSQGGNDAVVVETADMAEDYREVYDLMSGIVADLGSRSGQIQVSSGVMYKLEGMNTYMPMRFGLEVEVYSEDYNATMLELGVKLENAGFASIGIVPYSGSAGPEINGYFNSDKSIACEMYGGKTYMPQDDWYIVSLGCAKVNWHWMTDDEKELAKELEVAYYNEIGNYPRTLDIRAGAKIKNSEHEPYQTLSIGLSGGIGLFYRTSPESEWKYFTAVQAPLSCDAYDTEDLKKAFAGDVCYDGQTESTVQP